MPAPILIWPSSSASRCRHIASDCASELATAASVISPASSAAPRHCSMRGAQVEGGRAGVGLDQHRPVGEALQRPGEAGREFLRQLDAEARQQFEADQLVGEAGAAARQQHRRDLERRQRDHGGGARHRLGEQLQRGGGDDAERAFRAGEQVPQVIAGIVLAQGAEVGDQLAVRQHHLEPEAQIARAAEAQHVEAAGIGGEVAADLAGAFGRQAEREQAVRLARRLLQVGEDAAGLRHHGIVERIDRAHLVHALEAEEDRLAAAVRRRAAGKPGVAALRHDRRVMLARQAHDRLHLGGACRAARPRAPHRDRGRASR